jgi:hypothetical protein
MTQTVGSCELDDAPSFPSCFGHTMCIKNGIKYITT